MYNCHRIKPRWHKSALVRVFHKISEYQRVSRDHLTIGERLEIIASLLSVGITLTVTFMQFHEIICTVVALFPAHHEDACCRLLILPRMQPRSRTVKLHHLL